VDYKYYLTNVENLGYATTKATKYYQDRNLDISAYNRTHTHDSLSTTLMSIETWGVPSNAYGDFNLYSIMKLAAMNGISNVFKTSNSCRGTRSERIIGSVIDTLIKKYKYSRQEFMVITESGHIFDDEVTNTPATISVEGIIKDGYMGYSDIIPTANYCIHPSYLKYHLEKSLNIMNLKTIDVSLLSMPVENIATEHDAKEWEYRLSRAFEFLEEMILTYKIRSYGITTSFPSLNPEGAIKDNVYSLDNNKNKILENIDKVTRSFSPDKILKIAEEVGGKSHGFRYIASPLDQVNLGPILNSNTVTTYQDSETKEEATNKLPLLQFWHANDINFIGQNHKHFVNGENVSIEYKENIYEEGYASIKNLARVTDTLT